MTEVVTLAEITKKKKKKKKKKILHGTPWRKKVVYFADPQQETRLCQSVLPTGTLFRVSCGSCDVFFPKKNVRGFFFSNECGMQSFAPNLCRMVLIFCFLVVCHIDVSHPGPGAVRLKLPLNLGVEDCDWIRPRDAMMGTGSQRSQTDTASFLFHLTHLLFQTKKKVTNVWKTHLSPPPIEPRPTCSKCWVCYILWHITICGKSWKHEQMHPCPTSENLILTW